MSLREEIKNTLSSLGIKIDESDEHAIDFLIFIGCPVSYIVDTIVSASKGKIKGNCLTEVIDGLEKNGLDTRIEALIHGAYYFCSLGFNPEEITCKIIIYMQLSKIINSLLYKLNNEEIKSILTRLQNGEPISEILSDYSSSKPNNTFKI